MSWTTDSRHTTPHAPPSLGRTHGSSFCDVDGLELHARVAAPHGWELDVVTCVPDVSDVVLLHGLGVSSRYMVPLLEELGARVRCWAPDLPGHGRSEDAAEPQQLADAVDTLEAWLQVTGIEGPLLVANSWGCQVAVELARRTPVAGLLLIGPVLDLRHRSLARNLVRLIASHRHEPLSLSLLQAVDYVDTTYRRTLREFRAMQRYDLYAALHEVDVPITIARGEHDRISRRDWCLRLAKVHASPFVEVPGAGHCINATHPEEMAQLAFDVMGAARHEVTA
ncbi:MAG: alpha/beta hydrolase [Thermoleophilia bacterium]|nr:alpha/beta hydrolase [Thermoleophilia bacterium]